MGMQAMITHPDAQTSSHPEQKRIVVPAVQRCAGAFLDIFRLEADPQ
jgi:hypothetical protein